jgi:hypothetical protein
MTTNLFIVFLRRPGKHDGRSDPYWEFGSFGCTSCHHDNLLNPGKEHVRTGDRLAFVQGGDRGCKMLLITPPVERLHHAMPRVELRWDKTSQPFRYLSERAPVLAKPGAKNVTLAEFGKLVNGANRPTAQAKMASRLRTRSQPLDSKAAKELIVLFERARAGATASDFIQSYSDALPWRIDSPRSLKERRRDYRDLLSQLGATSVASGCRFRIQDRIGDQRQKCR